MNSINHKKVPAVLLELKNIEKFKSRYREFLQNLSVFELINFKLPWLVDAENQFGEGNSAGIAASSVNSGYEEAMAKRQRAISRNQQLEKLKQTLERLRIEQRRNDDEQTQVGQNRKNICNRVGF